MRLLGFIIKRLLSTVLILLAVSAISFFLLISSPGDPVRVNLAQHASADAIKQLDHLYGLDLPGWHRYLNDLGDGLHDAIDPRTKA